MSIENNQDLTEPVNVDSELKTIIVDYVGTARELEEGEVINVAMIVEAMAEEFPEFLLAVAEENWIRGYHQALTDVSDGEKMIREMEEHERQDEE